MAKLKETLRKFFLPCRPSASFKLALGVAVTSETVVTHHILLSSSRIYLRALPNLHLEERIQFTTPLDHMSFFERPWSQRRRGKTTDEENPVPSHQLAPSCMLPTVTRPDVSYAVQHLFSQFNSNPVILMTVAHNMLYDIYMLLETESLVLSGPKSGSQDGSTLTLGRLHR